MYVGKNKLQLVWKITYRTVYRCYLSMVVWGFSLGSKAITDSLKRQFEVVDVVRRVATFGIFVCVAVAVNETQSQLEFESESESEILSITESV